MTSLTGDLSKSGMGLLFVSGRIFGWAMHLWQCNIPLYINIVQQKNILVAM
jgi:hypothetical protein